MQQAAVVAIAEISAYVEKQSDFEEIRCVCFSDDAYAAVRAALAAGR